MLTQLADIFVPRPFSDRVTELSVFKNALIQSGAVVRSPLLDGMANAKGLMFDIPYLSSTAYSEDPLAPGTMADIDGTLSSDAPADLIEPGKVRGDKQIGSKLSRNWAWEAASLTRSAGDNVLDFAAGEVANVFKRADQRTVMNILDGIFAENAANENDMLVDRSGTLTTSDEIIDAAYSLSDSVNDLAIAVMHPLVIAALKKDDLANWQSIGVTGAGLGFETYLGMIVLADASMKEITPGNYESYLFAKGALGYGEAALDADLAVRLDRDNKGGGGRGIETLHYSRDFIYHPMGFSYIGTPAGATPSNAELALGTSWDRVVKDRRSVGIVKLISQA